MQPGEPEIQPEFQPEMHPESQPEMMPEVRNLKIFDDIMEVKS